MLFQKVNRFKRKRSSDPRRTCYRNSGNTAITDAQTGFIHHRHDLPLQYTRLDSDDEQLQIQGNQGCVGLLFQADERLKPGEAIEATIMLQNKPEKIRGKVVMVRDRNDHYEIGLWLEHGEDASRARILEQTSHIEAYIKEKKFLEGPFALNRDGAAEEWISKYAAGVPER